MFLFMSDLDLSFVNNLFIEYRLLEADRFLYSHTVHLLSSSKMMFNNLSCRTVFFGFSIVAELKHIRKLVEIHLIRWNIIYGCHYLISYRPFILMLHRVWLIVPTNEIIACNIVFLSDTMRTVTLTTVKNGSRKL